MNLNPTPHLRLTLSDVVFHRHLDCPYYNECLAKIASDFTIESFTCTKCIHSPENIQLLTKQKEPQNEREAQNLPLQFRNERGTFTSRKTILTLSLRRRSINPLSSGNVLLSPHYRPKHRTSNLLEILSFCPISKQQLFAVLGRDKKITFSTRCFYHSLDLEQAKSAKKELYPSGIICSISRASRQLTIKILKEGN